MNTEHFRLEVGGNQEDVRALMCHFQQDPYPGGLHYKLTIRDKDVIAYAKQQFGLGHH